MLQNWITTSIDDTNLFEIIFMLGFFSFFSFNWYIICYDCQEHAQIDYIGHNVKKKS